MSGQYLQTYLTRLFTACCLLAISIAFAACDDDDNDDGDDTSYDFSAILTNTVNNVIITTYEELAVNAAQLHSDIVQISDKNTMLNTAAANWISTRQPWEASESFLFGPAEFLSLDPSLDSWPVDRNQLDNVLASNTELTPENVANGLTPALRGFHTIEYLIFRDGQLRSSEDLSDREFEYLTAAAAVLKDDAALLAQSWKDGYGAEFVNAGESGSRFLSQNDAVLELVEGIIGICDEVANGKIADPYDNDDKELVESQFSFNSLKDFTNNIRSVQNIYLGTRQNGASNSGLHVWVADRDATLDARLQTEIADAIAAIQAIPEPFRNNLNQSASIEAAQEAINKIATSFEEDVKSLLN